MIKHYHVIKDGKRIGNFPVEDIHEKLSSGELDVTDLCWTEGMEEWQTIHSAIKIPSNVPPPAPLTTRSAPPIPNQKSEKVSNSAVPEFVQIPNRDKTQMFLLLIFTLGIYGVFLTAKNAQEISYLTKKKRLDFISIIILSIVTIGIFTSVYQTILAYDLHGYSKQRQTEGRNVILQYFVLIGNILSWVLGFGTAFFMIFASLMIFVHITWEVQRELNLYSNYNIRKSEQGGDGDAEEAV